MEVELTLAATADTLSKEATIKEATEAEVISRAAAVTDSSSSSTRARTTLRPLVLLLPRTTSLRRLDTDLPPARRLSTTSLPRALLLVSCTGYGKS